MKLASLAGGRDGRLAVVARDLARAALATGIAPTLQAALDDWARAKPALEALARELEAGRAEQRSRSTQRDALSPLPRAYPLGGRQRLRQSRRAGAQGARRDDAGVLLDRSARVPGRLGRLPAARRPTRRSASEDWGIDLEGEVAVVTDDVPMGTTAPRPRAAHPARHARQRLVAAEPDSRGARQGLRLLPVEAGDGVLAGRGDAG